MTEDSEDSNDVFFNSVVDYVDKIMFVFAQENQKMEVMEDAQAGKVSCPPVSPEAYHGGQAPGTLHHVIFRGIEKRRIVDDCGIPLAEANRQLGISTSAVSKMIRRRKSTSI
jgi:hypothetical protein